MKAVWYVASVNRKTGPLATSIIGESWQEVEASCEGCPQFDDGSGRRHCYAHTGLVKRGVNMVLNHSTKAKDLATVFKHAPDKRAVRMGAIGDPGRMNIEAVRDMAEFVRSHGAAFLSYSHFWRDMDLSKKVGDLFMASCEDWVGARLALSRGFNPAVIVPQGTSRFVHTSTGHSFLQCPAEQKPGRITCGDCRLCDPIVLSMTKWDGIMFHQHGSAAPWTPARRANHKARKLPVRGPS